MLRRSPLRLFLLSACALGPVETSAPRTYFLNPEISWKNPHGHGERIGTAVLLITQPRPQAGFDTARMAYLLRPYEINYYAFNQWADTPARMVHQIMVENLDKTGLWRAVLHRRGRNTGAVSPGLRTISSWSSSFSPTPAACGCRSARKLSTRKDRRSWRRDILNCSKLPQAEDAYGGVQAANHAAAKLLIELASWLDAVMKETK